MPRQRKFGVKSWPNRVIRYNPSGLTATPHFDYKHVSSGFYAGWGPPKILAYDRKQDYYIAWWGGHGIHAFSVPTGAEASFWNIHSAGDEPTVAEVKASIRRRMKEGDYP